MAKKDDFYFENFKGAIACSHEAALFIKETLESFSIASLKEKMDALHTIENKGDKFRNELITQVSRAFITPLERDDILDLSNMIDTLTDSIEEILLLIYSSNITSLRPDCIAFADAIVSCTSLLCDMMEELPNFKKSKKLEPMVRGVNDAEEDADSLYLAALRTLFTTSTDPVEILVWDKLYDKFENCVDTCDHISGAVNEIVISNT